MTSVNPNYVADGQDMSSIFEDEIFDRWYCDPPSNEENALKMYDTRLPSRRKLLREAARIIKKNSLMFFLLEAVNYQICPREIERIGTVFITIVPNNEIRTLNIYCKKGKDGGVKKIESSRIFLNAGIAELDFMTLQDVLIVSQNMCQKTVNVMSVENSCIELLDRWISNPTYKLWGIQ